MGHVIEVAQPADIPALLRLESHFPSDRLNATHFRYHLANPNAVFLAVRQGRGQPLLGYALFLRRKGQAARFYSLAVESAAQGQGLGRQLCEAGFRALMKEKATAVTLEVNKADTRAVGLYQSLGFQTIAELPNYYEDGRTALRMKKQLLK